MENFEKINTRALKELADIPAVMKALKLPWKVYRDKIYVLNIWRDDKKPNSAYFSPGKDGIYRFTDWADVSCNGRDIIAYVQEERGYTFLDACAFVAKESGFSIDDVKEEVDGEAEAKKEQFKLKKAEALRIAALLGLDGTAERKIEYQGNMWMDKDIIAIYPGYDRAGAKECAQKNMARINTITAFDLYRCRIDYASPHFRANYRKYCEMVEEGKLPDEEYYVVYKDFSEITLASLMGSDIEVYKDIVAAKKLECLDDIFETRKYLDENVFNEEEYDYQTKILDSLEKEVRTIDVE